VRLPHVGAPFRPTPDQAASPHSGLPERTNRNDLGTDKKDHAEEVDPRREHQQREEDSDIPREVREVRIERPARGEQLEEDSRDGRSRPDGAQPEPGLRIGEGEIDDGEQQKRGGQRNDRPDQELDLTRKLEMSRLRSAPAAVAPMMTSIRAVKTMIMPTSISFSTRKDRPLT